MESDSARRERLQRLAEEARKRPRPSREEVLRRRADRKLAKKRRKSGQMQDGMSGTCLPNVHKRAKDCRRFRMRLQFNGREYHGWQKQRVPCSLPPNSVATVQRETASKASIDVGSTSSCSAATTVRTVDGSYTPYQQQKPRSKWLPTIEGTLESCLRRILHQNARFFPSGRTDACVSARAQMVQFDANLTGLRDHLMKIDDDGKNDAPSSDGRLEPILIRHFNSALPASIRVLSLNVAAKNFSAMHPSWKRYIYSYGPLPEESTTMRGWCKKVLCPQIFRQSSICQENSCSDSQEQASFQISLPPNVDAMNAAAAIFVGTHDFAAFQSKGGRKTTVRTVHKCEVGLTEDGAMRLCITGSGFLMHMVRIIAGTLLEVGCGMRTIKDVAHALKSLSRRNAGPKLPSAQLCLDCVHYDDLDDDPFNNT